MTTKSFPLAFAKPLALKVLPTPAIRILRNGYYWNLRRKVRAPHLVGPIAERLGFVVQAGPFAGMVYPKEIVRADIESPVLPKLLGSYELECHGFVEQICATSYQQVINIGAGEGYYAVGLARRMSTANVIAFESHIKSGQLCTALARLNGVEDRVEVRGTCDTESLRGRLEKPAGTEKRTVILCDCEGAELDLLRPDLMRSLQYTDLLIELHDFVNPHISATIINRFSKTHHLEKTSSCGRDPDSYPALNGLRAADRAFLVSEHRSCRMDWLFCTSHAYSEKLGVVNVRSVSED